MYVFDVEKLKVGDILLTSGKGFASGFIRLFTWSKYSHVMIYIGNYSFIHAESDGGVKCQNIERETFSKLSQACVVRINNSEIVSEACEFTKLKINTYYSKIEAARTSSIIAYFWGETKNRQFCSRLVAESYENAGLKLVNNSSLCTPKEIHKSNQVQIITNCLRKITKEDLMILETLDSNTLFAKIQAEKFKQIRSITSMDIQNTEDLIKTLVSHPEFDEKITELHDKNYFDILFTLNYKNYHTNYNALHEYNPQNISKKDFIIEEIKTIKKMILEDKKSFDFYSIFETKHNLKFATIFKKHYEKKLILLQNRLNLCVRYKEELDSYS